MPDEKKRQLTTHQQQLADQLRKYRHLLDGAAGKSNLIQRTCINPLCNKLFGTEKESDRLCPKCRSVTDTLLDRCLPARDRS